MRFFLLSLGVLMIVVTVCVTMPEESWATFSLQPKADIQVEYNDNLFLTESGKVSDYLTIIKPSLSFLYKNKYLHTDLSYALEFRKYLDETYLDEDSISDIQRGDVTGAVLPEGRFNIVYEGSIDRVSIDERRSDVAENNVVNVITRYDGLFRPRYLYRLTPQISGEIAYQYSTTQYDDTSNNETVADGVDDFVDQDLVLDVGLDYSAQTRLLAETYYRWHDSDRFDDYEMWAGLAGFAWNPNSTLSLSVKAGGARTDSEGNNDTLYDTLYDLILEFKPPQKLSYFLSYKKDFSHSVDEGRYEWWEGAGGLAYTGRLSGKLKVFRRETSYQIIDREDDASGIEASMNYQLTQHVSVDLFANFSHFNYRPFREESDRYRAGCSVSKKFKKSSLRLRYVLNENDSDIQENDYRNNIVSLDYSAEF